MSSRAVPENYQNALLQKAITRIKSAPPDSAVVKANQHLLNGTPTVYVGGGSVELGGFIYYTLECTIFMTDKSLGIELVKFTANGKSWGAGAFGCTVAGAFYMDPTTIAGPCHYELGIAGDGDGVVTFTLWSENNGPQYGLFDGNVDGIGAGVFSGHGNLVVVPN